MLPLFIVISEPNENDVPKDVKESFDESHGVSDIRSMGQIGATRKEWAIATARNIEDCQQIEEAFKNISDLYLIREQYVRKRGLSMTRHGSVSCFNGKTSAAKLGKN